MIQLIWNGLSIGALYGLIAIGYTIIFGIIQVIFFAQGELSMLAAFAAMLLLSLLMSIGFHLNPTLIIAISFLGAIGVTVIIGVLSERTVIRPLRDAPRVKPLITSLGTSIVFQNAIMLLIGSQTFAFKFPFEIRTWDVLGVRVNIIEILMIITLCAIVVGIQAFLSKSRYGLAIRAVSQTRMGTRLMGLNINKIITTAFIVSSSIVAIAGLYSALYFWAIKFNMGFVPGIKGFTIAILGGIGDIKGAFRACFLIGIAEALFAGYISSSYRDVFVFILLITTLLLKPQGLLGEGD